MFSPIFETASEAHTDITFGKIDTEDQQTLAGVQRVLAELPPVDLDKAQVRQDLPRIRKVPHAGGKVDFPRHPLSPLTSAGTLSAGMLLPRGSCGPDPVASRRLGGAAGEDPRQARAGGRPGLAATLG
jgi:hypothetical protein